MQQTHIKELAEQYIEHGYSVTPVNGEKRPVAGKGWQSLWGEQIISPEYDWVWPRSEGLGLICGEASGVICLDIDILEDDVNPKKVEVRRELTKMLPPVFCGRIGNRKKPPARFYRYNGEQAQKFKHIDVEILSTGNQAVLPPSKHPSGVYYEWVGNKLTEIDIDDLPLLDPKILEWLDEINHRLRPDPVAGEKETSMELYSLPGRCKKGSHNYLSRLGSRLRYMDEPFESVVEKLLDADKKINTGESFLYFQWPVKFKKSKDAKENATEFAKEIFESIKPDPKYKLFPQLKTGFYIDDPEGKKKPVPDYHGFAEYAQKVMHLKSKENMNYISNGDFYEPIDKLGIEKYIYDLAGKRLTPHHSGNFVKMARTRCYYHGEFINPRNKLNLKNGILLKDMMKLVPHDQDEFFTYKIEHDYCEKTDTPVFDKFLDLISSQQEDKKQLLMEFIGYVLSGCDYSNFNKILILDGAGANGKTTFINIVQNLVGMKNISSVALESLKDNRFSASGLVGKLVNFCAEEPKSAFSASGPLKKLTGNDPYEAEFKHMGAFSFVNYAKFIISYNEMPFLPDTTSGMQRRLIIVPCVTDLEKNPELKIKNIFKKIAPEYGSIIHKCLIAFKMVEERGSFTEIQDGKDRYQELVRQSDPIADFVATHIRSYETLSEDDKNEFFKKNIGGDPFLSTESLWGHFNKFAGEKHRFKRRSFEIRVVPFMKSIPGVCKNDSNRPRGWSGALFVDFS